MKTKHDFLHWSNLLYALIILASLPITQSMGNAPPPAWFAPAVVMIVAQIGLILIPTLLFVWLTRQPLTEMLK